MLLYGDMRHYFDVVLPFMQMVLPLDVDSLVSSSLNMRAHNQQLLELTSAGTAIVIPAWETNVPGIDGQQIVTGIVSVQGKCTVL